MTMLTPISEILLTIASAPIRDCGDHRVIPTDKGTCEAAHIKYSRLSLADRMAAIQPRRAAVVTNDGPEEYEPNPYDGTYSED
jgi:hypothetical protein